MGNVPINPGMDSRAIEHSDSQGKGLARESSRPKTSSRPVAIHPGMSNRTNTTLGAPPVGAPPDASSPNPLDPTREGKEFPIPKASWGMKGGDGQDVERSMAHRVMAASTTSSDDFAKSLHTTLPEATEED